MHFVFYSQTSVYVTINRKWCFSPNWFFHPTSCPRLAWNILDLLWINQTQSPNCSLVCWQQRVDLNSLILIIATTGLSIKKEEEVKPWLNNSQFSSSLLEFKCLNRLCCYEHDDPCQRGVDEDQSDRSRSDDLSFCGNNVQRGQSTYYMCIFRSSSGKTWEDLACMSP